MHHYVNAVKINNPLSYNNSQIDQSIDFTRSVSNDHNNTMVVQFSSPANLLKAANTVYVAWEDVVVLV